MCDNYYSIAAFCNSLPYTQCVKILKFLKCHSQNVNDSEVFGHRIE